MIQLTLVLRLKSKMASYETLSSLWGFAVAVCFAFSADILFLLPRLAFRLQFTFTLDQPFVKLMNKCQKAVSALNQFCVWKIVLLRLEITCYPLW